MRLLFGEAHPQAHSLLEFAFSCFRLAEKSPLSSSEKKMEINAFEEEVLTFAQAAKILPRRRSGKKTHVCTLYRWATCGIKGIILETIKIGGTTCTSREALQRFFEALSEPRKQIPTSRPSRGRNKAITEAQRILSEDGLCICRKDG
jgi:hypothetical protein